jgi:hypothetical protein
MGCTEYSVGTTAGFGYFYLVEQLIELVAIQSFPVDDHRIGLRRVRDVGEWIGIQGLV